MAVRQRKSAILSFLLAAIGLGSYATPAEPASAATPIQPAGDDATPTAVGSRIAPELPRTGRFIGPYVGPYRLLRELGTGGMGTVYLAESTEPGARRVALKMIRQGSFTPELAWQFERERRALALADHDFVARLYDSGTTEEARGRRAPDLR